MKKTALLPLLLLTTLCVTHAAAPASMSVNMSEMKFTPSTLTLKAGQKVTITITNTGKVVHELQAYVKPKTAPKNEAAWDAYMQQYTMWLGTKNLSLTKNGKAVKGSFFEVELDPGQKGVLTFTPGKAGVYELACHKPGHYESGMKGTITVK